jgi:hypothetical protein
VPRVCAIRIQIPLFWLLVEHPCRSNWHLPSKRPELLVLAKTWCSRERMGSSSGLPLFHLCQALLYCFFGGCTPNGDLLDLRRCFAVNLRELSISLTDLPRLILLKAELMVEGFGFLGCMKRSTKNNHYWHVTNWVHKWRFLCPASSCRSDYPPRCSRCS